MSWDKIRTKQDIARREFLVKSAKITAAAAGAMVFPTFVPGIMSAQAALNSWYHQITVKVPAGFSGTPSHPTLHYSSITSGAKIRWPSVGQANAAQSIVNQSISSYNSFYGNLFHLSGASHSQILASGQISVTDAVTGSILGPTAVPGTNVNWAEVTNMIGQYVNGEKTVGTFPTQISTTWLSNGEPATWVETMILGPNGTSTFYITDPYGITAALTNDGTGITGMTFSGGTFAQMQADGWLQGLTSFVGETLSALGMVGFVYFSDIPTAGELPGQLYGLPLESGVDITPYLSGQDNGGIFDLPIVVPSIQVPDSSMVIDPTTPPLSSVGADTGGTQNGFSLNSNGGAVGIWYGDVTLTPTYNNIIAVEGQFGTPITINLGAGGAQDQLHQLI